MTMYKHFPSKSDLIRAVLEERDRRFREWFTGQVRERADSPRERLEAAFDVLGDWICGEDFRGCMFINAAAEFSNKDETIAKVAADHKRLMLEFLQELTEKAGAREPETLAYRLCLLLEGAIVMGHVCGDTNAAEKAKGAAILLLQSTLS